MNRTRLLYILFIAVISLPGCSGCKTDPNRIVVPVCTCIVRGAIWTKDPNPPANTPIPPGEGGYWIHTATQTLTDEVNQLVYDANNNVWIPGADIAMFPLTDKSDGYIKVIDDPDLSAGKYGDIEGTIAGGELVAGKCRAAWAGTITQDGLVLVVCRKIINNDGSATPESGFADPYAAVLARNGGADLCSFPRNLTKDDVKDKYIIIQDPLLLGLAGQRGNGIPFVILAHEFGHVLMLGHGDGLDNDGNGKLPPDAGPRLFDQSCDVPEFNQYDILGKTTSLMDTYVESVKTITPLQRECARTVAPLLPGAFGATGP